MNTNYIEIGHIVNTFGIKGELKITSDSDFINYRYRKDGTIYIKFGKTYEPHKVSTMRTLKGNVIITIDDLNDINEISKYVGAFVYASKEDIPPLKENSYLVDDLVGKKVYDENGNLKGILKDVIHVPSNDILEIDDHGNSILVPFVKEYIIEIKDDIKLKFLEISHD